MSKYVGESERTIKALFQMARERRPSIIFIDEIDSIGGDRSAANSNEASARVKTQFLVEMQGVGNDDRGVLVLGATNLPWTIDSAIRRRFEKRVYIALPDENARKNLLRNMIAKERHTLSDSEIDTIVSKTDGFSGADMAVLIKDAGMEPVRKC